MNLFKKEGKLIKKQNNNILNILSIPIDNICVNCCEDEYWCDNLKKWILTFTVQKLEVSFENKECDLVGMLSNCYSTYDEMVNDIEKITGVSKQNINFSH